MQPDDEWPFAFRLDWQVNISLRSTPNGTGIDFIKGLFRGRSYNNSIQPALTMMCSGDSPGKGPARVPNPGPIGSYRLLVCLQSPLPIEPSIHGTCIQIRMSELECGSARGRRLCRENQDTPRCRLPSWDEDQCAPKSNLMGRSEELIYRLESAEVLFEAEAASLLLV